MTKFKLLFLSLVAGFGVAGAAWAVASTARTADVPQSTEPEATPKAGAGCCVTGDCCCPGQGACCDQALRAKALANPPANVKKAASCCSTGNCCCPGAGSCCAGAVAGTDAKPVACCAKGEKASCCEK